MFKNYLKITLRNLKKQLGYAFINFAGLIIGITVFILISLYLRHEFSFDKYHDKSDRIYRVIKVKDRQNSSRPDHFATTPPALAPALKEFPEVIASTRIGFIENLLVKNRNGNYIEPRIYAAGPSTFDIFSLPFLSGNPQTALKDPFNLVLSERMAKKYFGHINPLGEVLNIGEKYDFKITGVIKDMPRNSHFIMDIIIPFATYFEFKFGKNALTEWSDYSSFYAYCLLHQKADPEVVENRFPGLLEKHKYKNTNLAENEKDKYELQPLSSIHLRSTARVDISQTNGDIRYIYLFSAIAVLILLIACINYMNLTTARSFTRSKEVGIRKVIGASKKQLSRQFLGETFLFSVISLLFSFILVYLCLPLFGNLMGRQLSFNLAGNIGFFIVLALTVLLIGLLSGTYPASYLSSLKPFAIFTKGGGKKSKGIKMSNLLVMLQFSVTIILVISTLVIRGQLNYINEKDVGYEKDQIIIVHTGDKGARRGFHQQLNTIKSELLTDLNILGVSGSKRLPNNINFSPVKILPGKKPGSYVPIYAIWGDADFIDLYGIKLKEGRNFPQTYPSGKKGAILINESAAKLARWDSPVGREITYWGNRKGTITGIMKDFHFHSLHSTIKPLCIYYEPLYFDYLSIKISGKNIRGTLGYIEKVLKKFSPDHPFEYQFFDKIFGKSYLKEQKTARLYGIFTFLAIIIGSLGLLALVSFAVENRRKEVGIRKTLGASSFNIMTLLLEDLLKWVALANIIGWPVAWFIMHKWLENFAYHITLSPWFFIAAGVLVFGIALATMGIQTIRAANANPIESLRYE